MNKYTFCMKDFDYTAFYKDEGFRSLVLSSLRIDIEFKGRLMAELYDHECMYQLPDILKSILHSYRVIDLSEITFYFIDRTFTVRNKLTCLDFLHAYCSGGDKVG